MNKRKFYTFIMALLVMIGIIASQVAPAADCLRNCPTPLIAITTLPPE
jgi:hypothetical protein